MSKITGDEPSMPSTDDNGFQHQHTGLTIRQLALKDFMCALVQNSSYKKNFDPYRMIDRDTLSEEAYLLTNAYIERLNM